MAELEIERLLARKAGQAQLRTFNFTVEPARTIHADAIGWEYEIRVALPASYAHSDETYPVLWLTDSYLESALAAIAASEVILVNVGPPVLTMKEIAVRRAFDLMPAENMYFEGPCGRYLQDVMDQRFDFPRKGGGAGLFLDFIVDVVRPTLAADYRMNPDDQCLMGFSAGGAFVAHALFARPGAFAKYICGSGSIYGGDGRIFELEEEYAATHRDLPAHVLFAAGDGEILEEAIAAWGCVSSTVKLAETLVIRNYPSLKLGVRIFSGERHLTVAVPMLTWAVRELWPVA